MLNLKSPIRRMFVSDRDLVDNNFFITSETLLLENHNNEN